jgi:ribonuclease HI
LCGIDKVIYNFDGAWIRGFSGNIGFSNILRAELLAVYHGLVLAWELQIRKLCCYSDSKTAINLITESVNKWYHYAAIFYNIKDILARDWRITISHTLRDGYACADYLAKFEARNLKAFSYSHPACWNESSLTSWY